MENTLIVPAAEKTATACLLIVDDNAQIGASLVSLFQRGGFIAGSVRNGRSAIEYLVKQRVDILITDIFMPNGDGLELLYELYRRKITPRVVAMTGSADAGPIDLLHVASLMGAERTIRKPFEPGKLLELVREMTGGPDQCRAPIQAG